MTSCCNNNNCTCREISDRLKEILELCRIIVDIVNGEDTEEDTDDDLYDTPRIGKGRAVERKE